MKYILTIDDDEALCKLVKKCIDTEQVPVYTFLRGEDALSFFYQNRSSSQYLGFIHKCMFETEGGSSKI